MRPLLARATWVPDLAAALEVQAVLPAGWVVVVRDGSAVVDTVSARIGQVDSTLERRAEVERLVREAAGLEEDAAAAEAARATAQRVVAEARTALETARAAESAAAGRRRRTEDLERAAGRDAEATAREAGWHSTQADRLAAEAARAATSLAALEAQGAGGGANDKGKGEGAPDAEAIAAWDRRVAELRARRDRLAADAATHEQTRREAEGRRARADAAAVLAEGRLEGAARDLTSLDERERAAVAERDGLSGRLAEAAAREAAARESLDVLLADDRVERAKLGEAERGAIGARERLRAADDRARSAEVGALEARLGLDALREQLLVELAGMGEVGLRHLAAAAGDAPAAPPPDIADGDHAATDADGSEETAAFEALVDTLAPFWADARPTGELPSPARLANLRRRFHELGAANPFAVDEYHALKERLETLDAQDRDLREAITKTRQLISELDQLIATQFRATFAALEVAFDARFQQLFGGGFARLILTDPTDLSATGIEITARPPGKKAQALAMLSGGERALTAVALLFAMLQVRPAPFCVLDEVDAALDEANVGRFTEALRELSAQTQFIVITHNRGTIEAADALYGVTVGDDTASRVISLRLEEAQAIAERRTGGHVGTAG